MVSMGNPTAPWTTEAPSPIAPNYQPRGPDFMGALQYSIRTPKLGIVFIKFKVGFPSSRFHQLLKPIGHTRESIFSTPAILRLALLILIDLNSHVGT